MLTSALSRLSLNLRILMNLLLVMITYSPAVEGFLFFNDIVVKFIGQIIPFFQNNNQIIVKTPRSLIDLQQLQDTVL